MSADAKSQNKQLSEMVVRNRQTLLKLHEVIRELKTNDATALANEPDPPVNSGPEPRIVVNTQP